MSGMDEKKWYLEFSVKQDCFHVETMQRIQAINLNWCRSHKSCDYVILSGPHTYEDASNRIDEFLWLTKTAPLHNWKENLAYLKDLHKKNGNA